MPHLCKHDHVPQETVEVIFVQEIRAKKSNQRQEGNDALIADDILHV